MKNSLARKAANGKVEVRKFSFALSGNVSIVGVSREAALAQGRLDLPRSRDWASGRPADRA